MNIGEIESFLIKVNEVIACKIITDQEEIKEIHIVAGNRRSAKQISRDIQSILISKYHLDIDHKKISIAQIQEAVGVAKTSFRLKIAGIEYSNVGTKAGVKVILKNEEETYEGTICGVNTTGNMERMLGNASLKAVEEFCGIEDTLILDDVEICRVGSKEVAVVLVTSINDENERKFSGSAVIKKDQREAIVKATLDAVNRHVANIF